jgi:hypothetical protein
MAQLTKMKDVMADDESAITSDVKCFLEKQVGWASSIVFINNASDQEVNDFMITWRVGANIGRHTKLKWLPHAYFFENDSDALMFMLTFNDSKTSN